MIVEIILNLPGNPSLAFSSACLVGVRPLLLQPIQGNPSPHLRIPERSGKQRMYTPTLAFSDEPWTFG